MIRGKYRAEVVLEFTYPDGNCPGQFPLQEIQKAMADGLLTRQLQALIAEDAPDWDIQVKQLQAEVWQE